MKLVNQSLRLVSRLLVGWKGDTLTILSCLAEKMPVDKIVNRIGISERAVFKRIRTNNLREVTALVQTVEGELAIGKKRGK